MLSKLDENLMPRYPKMFSFASQLKAGKGLIIAASIIEGDYLEKASEAAAAKQVICHFLPNNITSLSSPFLVAHST